MARSRAAQHDLYVNIYVIINILDLGQIIECKIVLQLP